MRSSIQRVKLFKPFRPSSSSTSWFSTEKEKLTAEQQEKLRHELTKHSVETTAPVRKSESFTEVFSNAAVMDEIRARGFLKYKNNYLPPSNFEKIIDECAKEFNLNLKGDGSKFQNLDSKSQFLVKLGTQLNHFVPSAKLHYIQSVEHAKEFYSQPVQNLTQYSKLARDESVPENLAVRENPARFHPNDKEALHGGITTNPGEGGKVYGLRNKRLYRQFQPKQEWFDYEDQTFDHDPIDKGLAWDPEIVKKMDRYVDMKFKKDGFYKIN